MRRLTESTFGFNISIQGRGQPLFVGNMKMSAAAAAAVVFVACSPDAPEVSRPSEPASVSPGGQSSGCPDEASLIDKAVAEGRAVPADLEGDGVDEQLVLAKDPAGDRRCQAILGVISSTFGRLSIAIDDELSFDLGLPVVTGTAEIDGEAPKEIIVTLASGASTGFAGLFSIKEGRLVRRTLEGDSPYSSLFPFGGSVGHLEGSDCAELGTIVVSSATAEGRGYEVVRRFFESSDSTFVLNDRLTEVESVKPKELNGFPEFTSAPFAGCRP